MAGGIPRWLPPEIYTGESGKIPARPEWEESRKTYEIYEPYMDKETWPRPYYSVDEADRLAELTTDIFNLTETQRAKWVCGQEELNDASWKKYVGEMENMGVKEMIEIYQAAYDRYQAGMPKK